jgi:hypothetical protein
MDSNPRSLSKGSNPYSPARSHVEQCCRFLAQMATRQTQPLLDYSSRSFAGTLWGHLRQSLTDSNLGASTMPGNEVELPPTSYVLWRGDLWRQDENVPLIIKDGLAFALVKDSLSEDLQRIFAAARREKRPHTIMVPNRRNLRLAGGRAMGARPSIITVSIVVSMSSPQASGTWFTTMSGPPRVSAPKMACCACPISNGASAACSLTRILSRRPAPSGLVNACCRRRGRDTCWVASKWRDG